MLCLSLGYIPGNWKRVKVIFIPKIGIKNHETEKDFRPISLSSFLLKTLERLIDFYIRHGLDGESILSRSQHVYLKGRSTETALYEVVRTVFLDIEGAFNNVSPIAIKRAVLSLNVDGYIVDWVIFMLTARIIESRLGNSKKTVVVKRGTPHGVVLSPLLLIAVLNSILLNLENRGLRLSRG